MTASVIDASAILAAILGEAGGDRVFEALGDAVASAVNVAEVYTYAAVRDLPTDAIDAFFGESAIAIMPFDHEQAIVAGKLAAVTRHAGLSLGDRACLAAASKLGAEALTADRLWERVATATGVTVVFLR